MYIITNRNITNGSGLNKFGKDLSSKGPHDVRMFDVTKKSKKWAVSEVIDELRPSAVKKLKNKYNLSLDESKPWHGSLQVACSLFAKANKEKKSILFYVHGYNNDVEDVMKTAFEIERHYKNVIVVPFTWPANGGGAVSGMASYLSDKSDARLSVGALNRVVGKIQYYHLLLTQANKEALKDKANTKHPDNSLLSNALFVKLMDKECPVKLNLLCHSMGNYLLKKTLGSSDNTTSNLVFDNVCLIAADANNAGHKKWVEKIDVRKRLYVVINEDDFALKAARIKPGDEQLARLGHYTRRLNSKNAHYIDLTNAKHVGREHSYFTGASVVKNKKLSAMFKKMFSGTSVEESLTYKSNNTYVL